MEMLAAFQWNEAWSGFVGAILGGAATFGGVLVAQRAETEREDRREERAARRARQERLRNAYGSLLAAAYEAQRLIGNLAITHVAKDLYARQDNLKELAGHEAPDVGEATVTLTLEREKEVLDAYRAVHNRLWRLQAAVLLDLGGQRSLSPEEATNAMRSVNNDVQELEALAQDRLAKLDPPSAGQVPRP